MSVSQSLPERRTFRRPKPPPPALNVQLVRLYQRYVAKHLQTWGGHAFVLMTGLLALIGVWWSMNHRISLIESINSHTAQYLTLSREVSRLQNMNMQDRIQTLQHQMDSYRQKLFPGYRAIAHYLHEQDQRAIQSNLGMSYRFQQEFDIQDLPGIRIAPIELTLTIPREKQENGFARLIAFASTLNAQNWRQDTVSLELVGDNKGAQKLNMVLHLWFADSNNPDIQQFLALHHPSNTSQEEQ